MWESLIFPSSQLYSCVTTQTNETRNSAAHAFQILWPYCIRYPGYYFGKLDPIPFRASDEGWIWRDGGGIAKIFHLHLFTTVSKMATVLTTGAVWLVGFPPDNCLPLLTHRGNGRPHGTLSSRFLLCEYASSKVDLHSRLVILELFRYFVVRSWPAPSYPPRVGSMGRRPPFSMRHVGRN